jgi:acyl-CoA synthetase (AMP-forming)/AMP-acid ligase II
MMTERIGRVSMTLGTLFHRTYEVHSDSIAVIGPDGATLSWGELGTRARRMAGGLRDLGLGTGDRVVVCTKNRPEFIDVDHALFAGGFVRVGVSYRLHPREVAAIARDSGARAIVLDRDSSADIESTFGNEGLDLIRIGLDVDSPGDAHVTDLHGGDEVGAFSADPEDVVWLPYTSGTTGQPKGVMISHRALLACLRNLLVEMPAITPSDRVLHVAPMTHLSGYVGMACATRGAAQIPIEQFEPERVLHQIAEHGITVLPMVPTMINALLPAAEADPVDVSSIHTILYGGSAIAPDRLARAVRAFGPVFVQGYGLTEVAFPLASMSKESHVFDPDLPPPSRLASAGRVTPFVELKLVTPEGELAEPGQLGEIIARGDVTMSGYWNRPEETATTLTDDGWVHTGDIGRLEDGYLHIVDRKKDMIVSGGFNIFPSEIENVISTLDAVDEVAVIGVPHDRWGESVHAVIALRGGTALTAEEVETACRSQLASYKTPRSIEFVDEIPKTGTGKVMRRQLRDTAWQGHERRVGG